MTITEWFAFMCDPSQSQNGTKDLVYLNKTFNTLKLTF